MGAHSHSVWIDASPEEVFDVYADVNRLPEWQVGIREISNLTGPGDRPGTTYVVRFGPFTSRFEILEVDRPRRLLTRATGVLGLVAHDTSSLTPEGSGTRLDILYETTWRNPRLGWLLEKAMLSRRTVGRELANLKALVERGGGAEGER